MGCGPVVHLPYGHLDMNSRAWSGSMDQRTCLGAAVHTELYGAVIVPVFYRNMIMGTPEIPVDNCPFNMGRQTGFDDEAVEGGADSDNPLGKGYKVPCGSAGEPGVFCFSMAAAPLSGYHLGIDIGFHPVQFRDFFPVGGSYFFPVCKGLIRPADPNLANHDPGIIVAENTAIFLVSRRIGRNLSQFQVIFLIGRVEYHYTVGCIQVLGHRVQCQPGVPPVLAYQGHSTEALGFYKDFTVLTFR